MALTECVQKLGCKILAESWLGCDSDGVHAKVLVLKRLWFEKVLALEQEACSRSPSKFSTLMGLDWRRQRYFWTVLGLIWAMMGVYWRFMVINTNTDWLSLIYWLVRCCMCGSCLYIWLRCWFGGSWGMILTECVQMCWLWGVWENKREAKKERKTKIPL